MKNNTAIIALCIIVIFASAFFITTKVAGVTFGGYLNMGGNQIRNMQDGSQDDHAATVAQANAGINIWTEVGSGVISYMGGNVAIGNAAPGTDRLKVTGGVINAAGGLVLENRNAATGDPTGAGLVAGRMWICIDLGGDCQ